MSVHNGTLIKPPVSIRDVQTVLGHSSGDLGTLIANGRINVWAKYKPVIFATVGVITDTQRRTANYGIGNIPVWSGSGAVNKMGNLWFGINTGSANAPQCGLQPEYWAYKRPTGGSSQPYRLSDFAEGANSDYGYKSDAQPPIGGCKNYTIKVAPNGEITIPFSGNGSGQSDGYNVPISELQNVGVTFGNLYLSFMLHKKNSNTYYVASRSSKWSGDNSTSVTTTIKNKSVGEGLAGDCEVFPFLSTKSFTTFTSSLASEQGPCVAMFEKSAIEIQIEYAKAEVSNFGAYYENLTDHALSYVFVLSNESKYGFTASYTVEFSPQSTFPSSDTVSDTGSIYISANSIETINKSVSLTTTANHYKNGYSRVIVDAAGGSGIIFYTQTSAASDIVQGLPR